MNRGRDEEPAPAPAAERNGSNTAALVGQLRRVIRFTKRNLRYEGSHTTDDILNDLLRRWLQSGHLDELYTVPREQRQFGPSVRARIIDLLRRRDVRGRGLSALELQAVESATPQQIEDALEAAELSRWLRSHLAALEAGQTSGRFRLAPKQPELVGRVLRAVFFDGRTTRDIAAELEVAPATVAHLKKVGLTYLAAAYRREFEAQARPLRPE